MFHNIYIFLFCCYWFTPCDVKRITWCKQVKAQQENIDFKNFFVSLIKTIRINVRKSCFIELYFFIFLDSYLHMDNCFAM